MNGAWRLIDTGPLDGPANMALDEALLSCFDPENSLPVFRLYGWSPPAFSLGKHQKAEEVLDLERCARAGMAVVRRVTGGGCIYHADEVTYSIVCAPRHISGVAGVKESYRKLCGFLILAYRRLGLDPIFAVDSPRTGGMLGERTPLCFAGTEEYDVTVHGRKLGGNAQRRTRGIIFQHGSIPLENRLSDVTRFLLHPPSADALSAASLADLAPHADGEILKGTLADAFAENLGATLRRSFPTPGELDRAEMLRKSKYLADSWNLEREER